MVGFVLSDETVREAGLAEVWFGVDVPSCTVACM